MKNRNKNKYINKSGIKKNEINKSGITKNRIRKKAGLFFVLFLACLFAGCGITGDILSDLKAESVLPLESPEEGSIDGGQEAYGGSDMELEGARKTYGGSDAETTEVQEAHDGSGIQRTKDAEHSEPGSSETSGSGAEPATNGAASDNTEEVIYVHVCGAVENPGVYEMPVGSRIFKAVEAAGGFTKEASRDYLNMAKQLSDGSRLEIPTQEEAEILKEKGLLLEGGEGSVDDGNGNAGELGNTVETGNAGASKEGEETGNLININTAGITELCTLPGIGESRAKAILEYREEQGGFQKKEDIMKVSGIGEKMYKKMEEYLTI